MKDPVGMAVERCSKAVLRVLSVHGKSPCFSGGGYLKVAGVDEPRLVFASIDVDVFME